MLNIESSVYVTFRDLINGFLESKIPIQNFCDLVWRLRSILVNIDKFIDKEEKIKRLEIPYEKGDISWQINQLASDCDVYNSDPNYVPPYIPTTELEIRKIAEETLIVIDKELQSDSVKN